MKTQTAVAHSNIALAKYWGKADAVENIPAVPSLSLTLDGLRTTTSVSFVEWAKQDELILDGNSVNGRPLARVVEMLDRVRAMARIKVRAIVESRNEFPTSAGLASSASGFAALALASTRAAELDLPYSTISALARRSSASAARSLWGGYVVLPAHSEAAEPLAPAEQLPLRMLVVLTTRSPKNTSSTDGMNHTAKTSPFYDAWVESAGGTFEEIRRAVLDRAFERLGVATEHSALAMHASMLAARPSLRYLTPATVSIVERVQELRASGLMAFVTIDAGPHVKVLTLPEHADQVEMAIRELSSAQEIIRCSGGPGAYLVEEE